MVTIRFINAGMGLDPTFIKKLQIEAIYPQKITDRESREPNWLVITFKDRKTYEEFRDKAIPRHFQENGKMVQTKLKLAVPLSCRMKRDNLMELGAKERMARQKAADQITEENREMMRQGRPDETKKIPTRWAYRVEFEDCKLILKVSDGYEKDSKTRVWTTYDRNITDKIPDQMPEAPALD